MECNVSEVAIRLMTKDDGVYRTLGCTNEIVCNVRRGDRCAYNNYSFFL